MAGNDGGRSSLDDLADVLRWMLCSTTSLSLLKLTTLCDIIRSIVLALAMGDLEADGEGDLELRPLDTEVNLLIPLVLLCILRTPCPSSRVGRSSPSLDPGDRRTDGPEDSPSVQCTLCRLLFLSCFWPVGVCGLALVAGRRCEPPVSGIVSVSPSGNCSSASKLGCRPDPR